MICTQLTAFGLCPIHSKGTFSSTCMRKKTQHNHIIFVSLVLLPDTNFDNCFYMLRERENSDLGSGERELHGAL